MLTFDFERFCTAHGRQNWAPNLHFGPVGKRMNAILSGFGYARSDLSDVKTDLLKKKLQGRKVFPVDLPAVSWCKQAGLDYTICAKFFDEDASEELFSTTARLIAESCFDGDLIPGVNASVNPLFVVAHWMVAFLGGIALRLTELEALSTQGERLLIVETSLNFPFVPQFGDVLTAINPDAEVLGGIDIWKNRLRIEHRSMNWRLLGGTMKRTFDAHLKSFDPRRPFSRPRLHLLFNDPNLGELLEANRTQGMPFSIGVSSIPDFFPAAPPRGEWLLAQAVKTLARSLHARTKLPIGVDQFVSAVAGLYEHFGRIFEGHVATALKPLSGTAPEYLLAPATTKMGLRASFYRYWRAGAHVLFQAYADGEFTGVFESDLPLYRTLPMSDFVLYYGRAGEKDRKHIVKCGFRDRERNAVILGASKANRKRHENALSRRYERPRHKKPVVFFLPTTFTWHWRVGPCRDLNDLAYWELQKKQLEVLASLEYTEIVYKAHPKSFVPVQPFQIEWLQERGIRFEDRSLSEVLDECDVLVSDYIASGFTDALYRPIPVVAVDFGYRKLHPEARDLLKRRVNIVDAAINDDQWITQFRDAVGDALTQRSIDVGSGGEFFDFTLGTDIDGTAMANLITLLREELKRNVQSGA